jgi:hypothetical protein
MTDPIIKRMKDVYEQQIKAQDFKYSVNGSMGGCAECGGVLVDTVKGGPVYFSNLNRKRGGAMMGGVSMGGARKKLTRDSYENYPVGELRKMATIQRKKLCKAISKMKRSELNDYMNKLKGYPLEKDEKDNVTKCIREVFGDDEKTIEMYFDYFENKGMLYDVLAICGASDMSIEEKRNRINDLMQY